MIYDKLKQFRFIIYKFLNELVTSMKDFTKLKPHKDSFLM